MAKSYIIIPAFNEGPNLGAVLQQLRELASTMPVTVIVVNDGSWDNTLQEAARAQTGDCIFIIEGDGTSDLAVLPEMARRIYNGDDVVIASRYVRGGGYVNFRSSASGEAIS